ncbi:MAG: hypothetical protein H6674_07880 [Dehalococcoidia bacterium]|nr:hypothetical protein [Dehalococcoidia bacterium]
MRRRPADLVVLVVQGARELLGQVAALRDERHEYRDSPNASRGAQPTKGLIHLVHELRPRGQHLLKALLCLRHILRIRVLQAV